MDFALGVSALEALGVARAADSLALLASGVWIWTEGFVRWSFLAHSGPGSLSLSALVFLDMVEFNLRSRTGPGDSQHLTLTSVLLSLHLCMTQVKAKTDAVLSTKQTPSPRIFQNLSPFKSVAICLK